MRDINTVDINTVDINDVFNGDNFDEKNEKNNDEFAVSLDTISVKSLLKHDDIDGSFKRFLNELINNDFFSSNSKRLKEYTISDLHRIFLKHNVIKEHDYHKVSDFKKLLGSMDRKLIDIISYLYMDPNIKLNNLKGLCDDKSHVIYKVVKELGLPKRNNDDCIPSDKDKFKKWQSIVVEQNEDEKKEELNENDKMKDDLESVIEEYLMSSSIMEDVAYSLEEFINRDSDIHFSDLPIDKKIIARVIRKLMLRGLKNKN